MTTDKRFQIFISSTFRDLIEERQAVLKAVLELDHMPAGMELFPASDETAWSLIKDVIDRSDYYVLIIGGRYGSLHKEGLGYTEMEYDYAVRQKKAVVPLLHQNPDNLPRGDTETDAAAWDKLQKFRAKVEANHTCNYWSSTEELKSKVITGLTAIVKRHPAVGWVRADAVPSGARIEEVLTLRDRIAELESELQSARTEAPPGTEDLLQGDDPADFNAKFETFNPANGERAGYTGVMRSTWNDVFSSIAPSLLNEAREEDLRRSLRKFLLSNSLEQFATGKLKKVTLREFQFEDAEIDTAIVQLRALGLIAESQRKRSVTNNQKYWALTPYGDQKMVQLRALHRTPRPTPAPADSHETTEQG